MTPPAPSSTDDLVVVKPAPFNAETPPTAFASELTPSRHVYVRSNFEFPTLAGDAHRIAIGGAVRSPLELSVAELRAMPMRTVVTTMECAGNHRSSVRPLPPGELWGSGAVSTVRWTGVPLATVLDRADVAPEAVEILAEGADAGVRDDAPGRTTFARALPLATARHPDTLLALAMNDEPLTPAHGAPVRLVVPGWYGMASVKWVARLEALVAPFDGYFHTKRYVYEDASGTQPVTRMRVKSVIVAPASGAVVAAGTRITVWGWAWSGEGALARVEVAIDGGDTWQEARLLPPASAHAWARWEFDWEVRQPGRYALRSRATDAAGHVQPDEAPWNRHGYGNNAVRPVIVDAR